MQFLSFEHADTLFTGNYSKEYLKIVDQWEILPVGAIIRSIYDIDSTTRENLISIANTLHTLHTEIKATKQAFKKPLTSLVYDYFSALHRIDSLNLPTYFKDLLKCLPIQYNYYYSNQVDLYSHYFYNPSVPPQYEVRFKHLTGDKIAYLPPWKIEEELFPAFNPRHITAQNWESFLAALKNGGISINQLFDSSTFSHLVSMLDLYWRSFYILISEVFQLQLLIKNVFSAKQSATLSVNDLHTKLPNLKYALPLHVTDAEWDIIKTTFPSNCKRSSFFKATTISALVYLELLLIEDNSLFVNTCACCQKPYITYTAQSKYCRFPNPALDGKTCQKEAPRLHNHEYKTLSTLRNKHRERYKKWVHSITAGKREYQEAMLCYIMNTKQFGPTRAARKKYYQSLLETINTNYINWCNDTKVALEEFKREKLTKLECEAKIKCPPVKKRCKEFYAVLHAAKASQEKEH